MVRGVLSVSVCGSNTDLVDYWLHVAAVGITRRAYYPAAMCGEYVQASPLTLMTNKVQDRKRGRGQRPPSTAWLKRWLQRSFNFC